MKIKLIIIIIIFIKRCIPMNIQEKSDLISAQDSDVVQGEWNAGTLDPETGVEQAETG